MSRQTRGEHEVYPGLRRAAYIIRIIFYLYVFYNLGVCILTLYLFANSGGSIESGTQTLSLRFPFDILGIIVLYLTSDVIHLLVDAREDQIETTHRLSTIDRRLEDVRKRIEDRL